MSDSDGMVRTASQCRRRAGLWLGVGVAILGLVWVAALSAKAGGFGRHGLWGRSSWHQEGAFDLEQARERADFATGWVLRSIDASEEQDARVRAIVANLVDDLAPLAPPHRENREAFVAQLAAASIDRAELHRIRQAELDLATLASNRLVEALADIAEVLTPEQRAELIEAAHRFHH